MNSDQFVAAVKSVLRPSLEPMGFRISTKTSGRAYDAECASDDFVAIVSFEPGDSFLLVAVLSVENGNRSSLDDREASPRLSDLNRRFLDPADVDRLELARSGDPLTDPEMARVVSAMRQLCLVLPKYVAERRARRAGKPMP
jgi:hypothetical protein